MVWLIMRRRLGHSRGISIRKFLGGLTFVLKPPGQEALIERLHNDPYEVAGREGSDTKASKGKRGAHSELTSATTVRSPSKKKMGGRRGRMYV